MLWVTAALQQGIGMMPFLQFVAVTSNQVTTECWLQPSKCTISQGETTKPSQYVDITARAHPRMSESAHEHDVTVSPMRTSALKSYSASTAVWLARILVQQLAT